MKWFFSYNKNTFKEYQLKKICDDFKEKVCFSLYYPFDTDISANIDLKCLKNQILSLESEFNIKKAKIENDFFSIGGI